MSKSTDLIYFMHTGQNASSIWFLSQLFKR